MPRGVALVAVGGYGRGELSPRSDLDLLLVHDGLASAGEIAAVADRLWYPVWDLGLALDHSVRTRTEVHKAAEEDLKVQLGLLEARHVAGDGALTAGLRAAALAQWRAQAPARLPELRETAAERARRHGELRYLLEPDLKEARGGLREATALRAVAASWLADAPREGLEEARATLLDVRDALHLATGRATDRLALQDQDQVAADLGLPDADAVLRTVYEAAGTLAYASEVTWREVGRVLRARSWGGAGEALARGIADRIGFGGAGTEVLGTLVRHHLLLVETATRRDLDDPATIRSVADAVGDPGTLELLHALTEADALATGPAAWSAWRVAAECGALPEAARLRDDLLRVLDGTLDLTARLAEREAAQRGVRRRGAQAPPRATVAPGGSRDATVIEVRAQDAPGLLHRIGHALEHSGARVRSAHVSTLGANAVDAFYVTDACGARLPDGAAARLAERLEAELG